MTDAAAVSTEVDDTQPAVTVPRLSCEYLNGAIQTLCESPDHKEIQNIIKEFDDGHNFPVETYPLWVAFVASQTIKPDVEVGLKKFAEESKYDRYIFSLICRGAHKILLLIAYVKKFYQDFSNLEGFEKKTAVEMVKIFITLRKLECVHMTEPEISFRTKLNGQIKNIDRAFKKLINDIFGVENKTIISKNKKSDQEQAADDDDTDSVVYLGKKVNDIQKVEVKGNEGRKTVKVQIELTEPQLIRMKKAFCKDSFDPLTLRFSSKVRGKQACKLAKVTTSSPVSASVLPDQVVEQGSKRRRIPNGRYT